MTPPNAKMTAKAKKAIEALSIIYNIKPQFFRRDRAAIQGMYADLMAQGYEWVTGKQEWALIAEESAPAMLPVATFAFAVDGVDMVEGQYIIVEGLKAAGYEVTQSNLVYDVNDPDHGYVTVEVKL